MASLSHSLCGECSAASFSVAYAREHRNRSVEIADWVMVNIPWTIAVPDYADFHDRWALLSRGELYGVEEELQRRISALNSPDADLDAAAAQLTGRLSYWLAAAEWLSRNPRRSTSHSEFIRLYGPLSRGEFLLAAIEHNRRGQLTYNGIAAATPTATGPSAPVL